MIKAIIGLGNPGNRFFATRHNIGFRVVDCLAEKFGASFTAKDKAEYAEIENPDGKILLLKPQTFMNDSGKVIPGLIKKGIKPHEVIVIHDELEFPFGKVTTKIGGSARGHNGLRSIIAAWGPEFHRVRCGIGRPDDRADVPDYVLRPFSESFQDIDMMLKKAVEVTEQVMAQNNP